jgi:tRNA dimethylallyltransferase
MWLQQQVQAKDPQFWSAGEIQNPQRLMRALEMVEATGQSILTFRNRTPAERPFRVIRLALELPREVLYERINQRVDYMMAGGLLQEATALYPVRHINALQTVGYTELFEYLDGATSLAVATDKIKQHTRHYAKRQLTWFRKDPAFTWIRPDADVQDIVARALKQ